MRNALKLASTKRCRAGGRVGRRLCEVVDPSNTCRQLTALESDEGETAPKRPLDPAMAA